MPAYTRTSPARAEVAYSPSDDVAEMSLLVWGEHCTECAAPACYRRCDLYESRPDTRCRRFKYGIYQNRHFSSFRGYGTEIEFKKVGPCWQPRRKHRHGTERARVARQERLGSSSPATS